jgi:ABC-type Fe3+-hydroxamate transport system substrate-binding protein
MNLIDDLDRKIRIDNSPKRIVSLVPSITELLFDLGLDEKIKGCTKYCVHPKPQIEKVEKVGGPKDFDLNKIRALEPDLIIAVKEENNKDLVLEIAKEYPLVVFDITNIESALGSIKTIGKITTKEKEANQLCLNIERELDKINKAIVAKKSACYLIWNKPMMTINSNTFISEMMAQAGFENAFSQLDSEYSVISKKDVINVKPEYILLSSEPFSFTEKHRIEYQKQFPDSKVVLVDGEMFSWYGSRILKAFEYFEKQFV